MAGRKVRIFYNTDQFDATVAFYTETLGLSVDGSWDRADSRGALVSAGGNAVIEVFGAARDATPLEPPPPGSFRIMIEVEDADRFCQEITDRGAKIATALQTKPWSRSFGVHDPNGVEISFFTPSEPR